MQILVEPGSIHGLNTGDMAMLLTAYQRFREFWPDAAIYVMTSAPELLGRYCPGAIPLEAGARNAVFEGRSVAARLRKVLPEFAAAPVGEMEVSLRQRFPRAAQAVVSRKRPEQDEAIGVYLEALRGSDLAAATGAGQLNDAFGDGASLVLNTLELAVRRGIPAVMLGQGIGPITGASLGARCRKVLPRLDLITLREGRSGPPILKAAGVRPERVMVTGDDAIEPAYARRPERLGEALGINVRTTAYAGISGERAAALKGVVQEEARGLGAPLAGVPISSHPSESDAEAIARLADGYPDISRQSGEAGEFEAAIEQAGKCRVVLSGSYHGAVFALAQGASAIGLANSGYYAAKFEGLAEQFGEGCRWVALDDPRWAEALGAAIRQAWEAAPANRAGLLEAAARQIGLGRQAYRRVYEQVTGRACALPR